MRNLAETLFGAYRRHALGLLLLHPDKSYYVRELARLTNVPPGSLHRELRLLAETGLLIRQPVGNQVRYQANPDCPVFEELAGFFRKTTGLADVLRDALLPIKEHVETAFVFGSVARGEEDEDSDVDVFVLGETAFSDVVRVLAPTRERIGREVNSVVMSPAIFKDKFRQRDPFLQRIVEDPKIFLIGAADDLAELTEYRST